MLYREFGRTGWQVSVIGLGTWNIGNQWGKMEDSTAHDIVRTAFDHGMNLFDTAESYGIPNGLSEIRLGRALQGIRDQVRIVSKVGNWGKRTGQGIPKTTVDMIRGVGMRVLGGYGVTGLMFCYVMKVIFKILLYILLDSRLFGWRVLFVNMAFQQMIFRFSRIFTQLQMENVLLLK